MVRYFYAWTPLVIVVGTFVLLSPYLALVALLAVSFVALGAFAWAIVSVLDLLSRAISRLWHGRSGASPRTAPGLSPAARRNQSVPAGAAVLLAKTPSEREHVS
jgi:hypothetical protein